MKIVIIGGNAAGAAAAPRLRRLQPEAEIVVLERGEYVTTASCGLPYYIGGIVPLEKLYVHTPESFRKVYGVDLRIRTEVKRILPKEKKVLAKDLVSGREYEESYDKLLLTTGAEPVKPPIPGAELPGVFTLRGISDAVKIRSFIESKAPRRCVIVGGGSIGVEMAHNLHGLGMKVTIVEFADHAVGPLDLEMAAFVQRHIREKGVELLLKTALKGIEPAGNGSLVALTDRNKIETDMILLSVGVRPESALAMETGIALGVRGTIAINEFMQTSEPDIYAAGDAVETTDLVSGGRIFVPLSGPANRQGKLAAENICCAERPYRGTAGAAVLLAFDLTAAWVGMNERTAAARMIPHEASYTSARSHAGYYPGAEGMTVKLVFETGSGRLLGAQAVGRDNTDKVMDVLATALQAKMTVEDLGELELCYAPPFASMPTPVAMAGNVALNVLTGEMPVFHWHEAEALGRDPDTLLVDVGSPKEYAAGHIPGAVNIPVSALEENLPRIEKAKRVRVYSHSAAGGHEACIYLTGRGLDCRSLAGGYALYEVAASETAH
ncbi:FAD-dependent oxidoreductase [Papillibacter cinnamivorans]|uniref:NADPH-dependent 2,4-dienoyl-CoA reductase, sulfur reductase n=1 Tax=Papillibacter cinnamivorans DSM 12816 TaxID=1122930 RepID=A0A1W2B730_9FIRM|nr:FAD-dependent oxidoreductase [Papillibacter cinnamivorans]SMC68739.1 NADPH-dependent 2,4-dienoyl-CoA reductase, sulfur reductase [Papillibacter cinnamivorans DSM 12816]